MDTQQYNPSQTPGQNPNNNNPVADQQAAKTAVPAADNTPADVPSVAVAQQQDNPNQQMQQPANISSRTMQYGDKPTMAISNRAEEMISKAYEPDEMDTYIRNAARIKKAADNMILTVINTYKTEQISSENNSPKQEIDERQKIIEEFKNTDFIGMIKVGQKGIPQYFTDKKKFYDYLDKAWGSGHDLTKEIIKDNTVSKSHQIQNNQDPEQSPLSVETQFNRMESPHTAQHPTNAPAVDQQTSQANVQSADVSQQQQQSPQTSAKDIYDAWQNAYNNGEVTFIQRNNDKGQTFNQTFDGDALKVAIALNKQAAHTDIPYSKDLTWRVNFINVRPQEMDMLKNKMSYKVISADGNVLETSQRQQQTRSMSQQQTREHKQPLSQHRGR